jgi:microcompartment protein CcmL/EutN
MKEYSLNEIDANLSNLANSEPKLFTHLSKIINQLPSEFKDLIEQGFRYKRVPKEYIFSSILFAISTGIGKTFYLESLGYKNYGNCYFTIVGSRGDAKSEAIKIATSPIIKHDDKMYKEYVNELKTYGNDKSSLKRKQTIIQNATIEAAQSVHYENPNSIGLYMDEIYALIEKIANPNSRDGISWRNTFLEGYTNGFIDISRKTTKSFRIEESYPTLIGGLQYSFIPKLFAYGNLESGFIDRLFFTTKITSNIKIYEGNINPLVISRYEDFINKILEYKTQSEKDEEVIKSFKINIEKEAEDVIKRYTENLYEREENAKSIEKEYYAKMRISIHKLCVLVYIINHSVDSITSVSLNCNDVKLAMDINEFYFENFKVIISEYLMPNTKVDTDKIIELAKSNNASQKSVCEVTGISKSYISKKWNKNEKLETLKTLK